MYKDMYKVIYKRQNGDLVERTRSTYPGYSIGDETGMGWLVVDILWQYGDGYYSFPEYCRLRRKDRR